MNLVNEMEEQAALREQQEHACAEHLFQHFDWATRTAEVEELISFDFKTLTAAHTRFMQGYSLDLQLLFNSAAMALCELFAKTLVALHGANWLQALENEL